jgi:hypothetical protein
VDVVTGASGSSKTPSTGSVTTTSANELIFGAATVADQITGPGTGFTSRIITSPDSDIAEDRVVSAVGAYSAAAPQATISAWVMQMVTFK